MTTDTTEVNQVNEKAKKNKKTNKYGDNDYALVRGILTNRPSLKRLLKYEAPAFIDNLIATLQGIQTEKAQDFEEIQKAVETLKKAGIELPKELKKFIK